LLYSISVRIGKNGAFDNYHRQELEPLGQEVLPIEPPEEAPQSSSFNGIYSAEEPEWQCRTAQAMSRDFFKQPVHCQKAQMERNEIDLPSLFPSREGNPQGISAPPAESSGTGAGGEEGMPVNPTPTNKPTVYGKSRMINPSQMPSADGCNWDSQGRPDCAVQSQSYRDDPIEANSAENGGNSLIFVNYPYPDELKKDFNDRLKLNNGNTKLRE